MIRVAGEALIDAHLNGAVIRPHPGGGPYNTAIGLARLGLPVTFSGALSSDPLGQLLHDRLMAAGAADGSLCVDDAFNAGLLAWLSHAGCVETDRIKMLEESELQSAVAYAAAAGAVQCTRPSAWGPRPDDVRRVFEEATCELA